MAGRHLAEVLVEIGAGALARLDDGVVASEKLLRPGERRRIEGADALLREGESVAKLLEGFLLRRRGLEGGEALPRARDQRRPRVHGRLTSRRCAGYDAPRAQLARPTHRPDELEAARNND
jgi:hypothetical protein